MKGQWRNIDWPTFAEVVWKAHIWKNSGITYTANQSVHVRNAFRKIWKMCFLLNQRSMESCLFATLKNSDRVSENLTFERHWCFPHLMTHFHYLFINRKFLEKNRFDTNLFFSKSHYTLKKWLSIYSHILDVK